MGKSDKSCRKPFYKIGVSSAASPLSLFCLSFFLSPSLFLSLSLCLSFSPLPNMCTCIYTYIDMHNYNDLRNQELKQKLKIEQIIAKWGWHLVGLCTRNTTLKKNYRISIKIKLTIYSLPTSLHLHFWLTYSWPKNSYLSFLLKMCSYNVIMAYTSSFGTIQY